MHTFRLPAFPGLTFRLWIDARWRSRPIPEIVAARMSVVQVERDGRWLDFSTVREDDALIPAVAEALRIETQRP